MDDPHSIAQEVAAEFDRLAAANYYALLGVDKDAEEAEIRQRFRELARKYHADRYAGLNLPSEIITKMTRLLSRISRAHSVLTDPEKRRDYDATLAIQAVGVPTDLGTIVEAESLFRAGVKLMDQGNYESALNKLVDACKLNPAESEFSIAAAYCKYWTLSRDGKGQAIERHAVKVIVEHLADYLRDHHNNDVVYVQIARIAKAEGQLERANEYFQEALLVNPNNVEAAREVRLLAMRKKKSGFFKRIFTKQKKLED